MRCANGLATPPYPMRMILMLDADNSL